jgi:hypothetical protein
MEKTMALRANWKGYLKLSLVSWAVAPAAPREGPAAPRSRVKRAS